MTSHRIRISNLPPNISELDLVKAAQEYGKVVKEQMLWRAVETSEIPVAADAGGPIVPRGCCYVCGDSGHVSRDCIDNDHRDAMCHRCGRMGHVAAVCKTSDGNRRPVRVPTACIIDYPDGASASAALEGLNGKVFSGVAVIASSMTPTETGADGPSCVTSGILGDEEGVEIRLSVRGAVSKSTVDRVEAPAVVISVVSSTEEQRMNCILNFMAKVLNVKRQQLKLVPSKGKSTSRMVVFIANLDPSEVRGRLTAACSLTSGTDGITPEKKIKKKKKRSTAESIKLLQSKLNASQKAATGEAPSTPKVERSEKHSSRSRPY